MKPEIPTLTDKVEPEVITEANQVKDLRTIKFRTRVLWWVFIINILYSVFLGFLSTAITTAEISCSSRGGELISTGITSSYCIDRKAILPVPNTKVETK